MRASAAASEDLLAQINQLRLENDELRSKAIVPFDSAETLAAPENSFRIQYRYAEWDGSDWRKLQGIVNVDWKTLLVLVAPQFATPRKNIVGSLLGSALKEKKLIPASREEIDIFATDLETIKAQLQAYGFIALETGALAREGRAQLTPLGQRRYLEWGTIKAA